MKYSHEMYDHSEIVYNVHSRGYTVLDDFLHRGDCLRLKSILERELSSYKPIQGIEQSILDKCQIHDLMVNHLEFLSLIENPILDDILSLFLGKYWIMYASTSSSIPPNGVNHAHRVHNDCRRFSRDFIFNIGVIWALDEYDDRNGGALMVLPGSHHVAEPPSIAIFEKNAIPIYAKEGSLIIFNAYMMHRTSYNYTSEWNHSMTLNACRPFMKPRIEWTRFVPERLVSRLSDRGKRILGFDARVPSNLDEFFVPPENRLYKANQD